jgi:hypothetical protein
MKGTGFTGCGKTRVFLRSEGYGLHRLRKKALIFLWASRLGAILAVLRAFPFAFAIYFRFAGCLAAYRDTAPFSWPSLEAE